MTPEFAKKLCDPFDKYELELTIFLQDEKGNILEGLFSNPRSGRYYPIVYGIPIMSPDEYREEWLERNFLSKHQLDVKRDNQQKLLLIKSSNSAVKGD